MMFFISTFGLRDIQIFVVEFVFSEGKNFQMFVL